MKKPASFLAIGLFILLILILLTSGNLNEDTATVKNGTYVMEHEPSEAPIPPRVTILDDRITFSYDLLSSYLPVGTYQVEDQQLTMITDDKNHHYAFLLDGDRLIFLESKSSNVKLLDDRIGTMITDQAVFRLQAE